MSIFESKPQIFWRKIREGLGKFFGSIGKWLRKMSREFRELPRGARGAIYAGGSMLVVLLVFAIGIWPMLQRPEPETEGPQRETVAEAIGRITSETRRPILPEEVPELVEDIDDQVHRVEEEAAEDTKKAELLELYSLRARVYFNAMMYHDSAASYLEILDRDLIQNDQYFGVYSSLFYAYTHANDPTAASHYAALTVEEYLKGYMEDDGGCVTYAEAANIDIKTCPSIFDISDM